jgi:hypothetical protein
MLKRAALGKILAFRPGRIKAASTSVAKPQLIEGQARSIPEANVPEQGSNR